MCSTDISRGQLTRAPDSSTEMYLQPNGPTLYDSKQRANHRQHGGNTLNNPWHVLLERYTIGSRTIMQPLVSLEHLKAHLGLLGAFYRLRTMVEAYPVNSVPDEIRRLDVAQRWAWFVGLAVERRVA